MPPRQREVSENPRGWSLTVASSTDGAVVIIARGEFDVAAVSDVHATITRAAGRRPVSVSVDVSGVTFLDAAMLGALVTERQILQASGADLTVVGVTPWSMRIIEICGLREILGL